MSRRSPRAGAGNQREVTDDQHGVDCVTSVEILSAELDGAATEEQRRLVRQHLAGCAACERRRAGFEELHRAVRIMPAEPGPDVTETVLPALRPRLLDRLRGAAGRRPRTALRWLLALVAAVQLGVALLQLTGVGVRVGDGARSTMPHLDHETGAWNAAVAVALAWVALRAGHAAAQLPVLASFTGVLGAMCLVDLITGRVGPERVISHLPVLLGLVLVAVLALLHGSDGVPAAGSRSPGDGAEREVAEHTTTDALDEGPSESAPPPVAHRESA
ncbi:Predicted anti-sigma-YlaC factor YlaD, contains Zn-finger domain [Actinopolyspora mzabensis]|uniref:Predicted anti-sigma-YlaC factor YlaD, contains Zn-finger domain n=1 Tax=Actinopolyspora mzabensis TaxID=995066 RepID=A0A1G9C1R9_ACTMZ|nr:zf-HC2 domain-containing protein [Actinopolyspora mzabensis]SDK45641.1 Predicted anti-sigma-YlaC factor YlaD, contains Zn-finger domain [Actinopolyspora mzabensis]